MKRLALLAAFLALPLALAAQTTSPNATVQGRANGSADIAGLLYAANFAHWTASPTPSGTRWDNAGQCYATSGGITFPMFSTTAPITIVDSGVPANTETVTPTNAFYSGSGCSVSLPATHAHTNYYLQSGTLGLQEALNWAGSTNSVVVVTPDWVAMGGTSAMITAAALGTNSTILDERTNAITVPNAVTTTKLTAGLLATSTKCASSASPAVCAAAPAGFVVVAASATTVVVNTTAVTATSAVLVQEDSSLGTALSVTCNATPATAPPAISARTAATSFTITTTTPTANPRCFSYLIVN